MEDLEIVNKELILIPVNNNSDFSQAGGTHWSMLAWKRKERKFVYMDPMNNYNLQSAQTVKKALSKVFSKESQDFEIIKAPQQENSYDCGVFCMAFASYILQHPGSWENDIVSSNSSITQQSVTQLRESIIDLIGTLKKK